MKYLPTSASLLAMALLTPAAAQAAMIEMTDAELESVQAESRPGWSAFAAAVREDLADFRVDRMRVSLDEVDVGLTALGIGQAPGSGQPSDAGEAGGWPFHPLAWRRYPLQKVAALPAAVGKAVLEAELRFLDLDGQLIDLR